MLADILVDGLDVFLSRIRVFGVHFVNRTKRVNGSAGAEVQVLGIELTRCSMGS